MPGDLVISLHVVGSGLGDDMVRQGWGRAVAVPFGFIGEPITDVLLVEGRLTATGLVLVSWPEAGTVGSEDFVG